MATLPVRKLFRSATREGEVVWMGLGAKYRGKERLICDLQLSLKTLWQEVRGRAWLVEKGTSVSQ